MINLEDMLQNGTVISETMIEKPHSFYTACNITTQIIAQVASNQYGGQSFSLAHLAPFVDISRKKLREHVIADRKACGESMDEKRLRNIKTYVVANEIGFIVLWILSWYLFRSDYGEYLIFHGAKPYTLDTTGRTDERRFGDVHRRGAPSETSGC